METIYRQDLYAGKTVFVAGGTSGINLAVARGFAAAGARVSVMSRKQDKVDDAVAQLKALGAEAMGFAADVRDFDAVKAAFVEMEAAFGKLNVIISGAAGNFVAPAEKLSANGFKTVVDIDLIGTFHVLRAGFDHLAHGDASIINVSAPQSSLPYAFQAHVCSAKAGIDMLSRSLALEWGRHGIRVNSIQPGPIDGTEGMERLSPTPEIRRKIENMLPLLRYGQKQEIVDLVLFLCSPAARYITGAVIPCDGGQSLVGSGGMASGLIPTPK